jgi:hypothetical protein
VSRLLGVAACVIAAALFGLDRAMPVASAQSTPPPRDTPTPPTRATPTSLASPTVNLTPVRATPTPFSPPRGTPTSPAGASPQPTDSATIPSTLSLPGTAVSTPAVLPVTGGSHHALLLLVLLALGGACLALGRSRVKIKPIRQVRSSPRILPFGRKK